MSGTELIKGHREITRDHCGSIQATCNTGCGDPFAAAAEEMALRAMAPTALPELGAADPSYRATVTSVPPRTVA